MYYSDDHIDLVTLAMQSINTERALREEAEAQLEAVRGKVLFADALSAASDSILVGDLAIMLKQGGVEIGQERLFAWLRAHGYLYRQPCGQNVPTQRSLELGIMELKHGVMVGANGKTSVKKTPKITAKGQLYLFDKVMADKDAINAMEAAKKAERMKRDSEARRLKRQSQAS